MDQEGQGGNGGITGADYLKVPSQSQKFGQKQASDLIAANVSIQWSGVNGKVTGDIRHVDDYSDLYGQAEKAGNFFPLELTTTGKELKTTYGETVKTQPFPDDSLLVARLKNKSDELKIEVDGKEVANLDFSGATFAGAVAARAASRTAVKSTAKKTTK